MVTDNAANSHQKWPGTFPIGLLLVVTTACAARFEPLVAHRVWENKTKQEVFDAAIRALHGRDMVIAAADRDAGLIVTDWKEGAVQNVLSPDYRFRIRINLLVFDEAEGYVAVSFKSWVQSYQGGEWRELQLGDRIDADGYKRLTQLLDDFFLEVQRYVGPSVQRR